MDSPLRHRGGPSRKMGRKKGCGPPERRRGRKAVAELLRLCGSGAHISRAVEHPFLGCLGDLTTMEVYLRVLERYRDSGKRQLWVYDKCLIVGISGEILAKIAGYRHRREPRRTLPPESMRSWTTWEIIGRAVWGRWSSPGPCSNRATTWKLS